MTFHNAEDSSGMRGMRRRIGSNTKCQGEAEQVFFNRPLVVGEGEQRAELTRRYYALGHTDARRLLFIVLTIRDDLIRVISARPMSRRERRVYEHAKEDDAETDPAV